MSPILSGLESWLPLVALLWLASIVVLVVAARRYFASRALDRPVAETIVAKEPFIEARAASSVSIGQDAREAVRARVARDPGSAHGLRELVRALYLDQSKFTFSTLAKLSAEDRELAKALIEEWLSAPSALEPWEELYDAVRENPPVLAREPWPQETAESKLA